jgi:hypothetical protein
VAGEHALGRLGDVEGFVRDLAYRGAPILAGHVRVVEHLNHLIGVFAQLIGGAGPHGRAGQQYERDGRSRQPPHHAQSIRCPAR